MPTSGGSGPQRLTVLLLFLRAAAAAGLAIDAYVHADLASLYAGNVASISQGDLFLIEAGVASAAALIVLVFGGRAGFALAAVVAASALGAILLYRYVNVGAIGPFPNMYEPVWYAEKATAAIAEATAVVTAGLGLVLSRRTSRPGGPAWRRWPAGCGGGTR